MRIDLVVGERGGEIVAAKELQGFMTQGQHLLERHTHDAFVSRLEGKFLHLAHGIDTAAGDYGDLLVGGGPGIVGGELQHARHAFVFEHQVKGSG